MNILQVIPTFGMGGAETMCAGLCHQLQSMGHSVTAVSLSGDRTVLTKRLEADHVPVRYLDKSLGLDLGLVGRLKKLIAETQPQIIHTHLHALKYAALASPKVPIVHTVHNEASKEAVFLDKQIAKHLFLAQKAIPVALTREIQQSIAQVYGLESAEIPIVTNGIDLSRCQKKSEYTLHYPIEILHIGRFFPQKNHGCILQALALLKKRGLSVRLHCCGDGPLLEEVREQAKAMGLQNQIVFEGIVEDVYPLLSQADLFILPSSWEGMPMTVIEAMASGLPAIASRVGGIPDMVTDGESGLLIVPTPQALADAVERLAKDEALRQHLGAQGIQSAQRFSLPAMAQGYLDLYEALLQGERL